MFCLVALCCGLWNGGVCVGVWVCGLVTRSPLLSVFLFLFLFLFVLVFGVVRAQPCEHARYPRTPLSLPCCCCLVFSLFCAPPFFHHPPFFCCWNGGVCLPCVGVLCWHDSNRESVSFVFVFLVVACSAFPVSSVAASAVAFGAEDSPVVWVVGSS